MTHDEAFIRAIIENPDDDSPRLIYADWLEEHDDTRAVALRSNPELSHLLAGLKSAVQAPYDVLESHADAGRIEFLSALALLIERGRNLIQNQQWPGMLDSVLDHIERLLALTPGQASADSLVQGFLTRTSAPKRIRSFASLLASGQPQCVLLKLFDSYGMDGRFTELFACLAQEMVLRIGDERDLPPVVRFVQKLRAEEHPLAYLPLVLMDIENEFKNYLPQYGNQGSSWSMALDPSRQRAQPLAAGSSNDPITVREVEDSSSASRIGAAVRNWQEESNGQVEVRVFQLPRPIGADEVTVEFLRSLGLDSLREAEAQDIRGERIPPSHAANILFSAASSGGAYSRGLLGAYGRLETWHSLAGLAGASDKESVQSIAAAVERCMWFSFDAASEWFYQIAWDLGLMVIRQDGMSLAVLAASDTD
jgi:uncharacterized protein (TIGR02996 family)